MHKKFPLHRLQNNREEKKTLISQPTKNISILTQQFRSERINSRRKFARKIRNVFSNQSPHYVTVQSVPVGARNDLGNFRHVFRGRDDHLGVAGDVGVGEHGSQNMLQGELKLAFVIRKNSRL